jgi:hypothetical protein
MPIAHKLPARSRTVLPRAMSRTYRRPAARPETTTHDGPGGSAPDTTARGAVSGLGTTHCCPNCGHAISVISLIVAPDDEQPERADDADRGVDAGSGAGAD